MNETMERHFARLWEYLQGIDSEAVVYVADCVLYTYRHGGVVYTFGNGGSAANAIHLAADLSNIGVAAVCLSSNIAVITALANDQAFGAIYAEQVKVLAHASDLLIGLTVSGKSDNVLSAMVEGSRRGAYRIGLTGEGGAMEAVTDSAVVVPGSDYEAVEDAHSAVCHIVKSLVRERMRG